MYLKPADLGRSLARLVSMVVTTSMACHGNSSVCSGQYSAVITVKLMVMMWPNHCLLLKMVVR